MIIKIKTFLLLLIGMFFLSTEALAYDLKEYYPLNQADQWFYSKIEDGATYEQAISVEGTELVDGIEMIKILNGNTEEFMAVDTDGIKKYKEVYPEDNEYLVYEPALVIIPASMEIGESKSYPVTFSFYDTGGTLKNTLSGTADIKLEAAEDISVPAGEFTGCLKLSLIYRLNDPDNPNSSVKDEYNFWLAKGIGKVKISRYYMEEDSFNVENALLTSAVINGESIGNSQ